MVREESSEDLGGSIPGVASEPSRIPETRKSALLKDVGAAVAAATSTSLAVFLVGALAVQMRASLHFGPDALGLAVSLYYLGAAGGSIPFGRLAEAVGGVRMMRPTAILVAILLTVMAALVRSWTELAIVLFFAGILSAAMQPATNLFLARRIPANRQGLAFGVKQAAIPLAALLGGLAVPGIALTVGWQWAFVGAAFVALGAAIVVPKSHTTLAAYRARRPAMGPADPALPLVVLGIGFGLGVFAATGLTAFLVTSGVATGLSKGDAGFVAASAGAVAFIARIVTGILADRRGRAHFKVVSSMLAIGVMGYVGLAAGSALGVKWLFVGGAVVAFGSGWGWNGLFNYAVIRTHQRAPARATGITQVGGRLAGVLGPITFGLVVAHGSYGAAWLVNGFVALIGSGIILFGRHLLMSSQKRVIAGAN